MYTSVLQKIKSSLFIDETMYADDYEQEPEQVTLTNQWLNTKKHGRDDKEIERDKKRF